jgi:hypothetical protein
VVFERCSTLLIDRRFVFTDESYQSQLYSAFDTLLHRHNPLEIAKMSTPAETAAGKPGLGAVSDSDLVLEAYAKLRISGNPGLNIGPIVTG